MFKAAASSSTLGVKRLSRPKAISTRGGQGCFKTGRYLRFAGHETSRHDLLLMHHLRYFRLDISKGFGHPDHALGDPLPGVSV